MIVVFTVNIILSKLLVKLWLQELLKPYFPVCDIAASQFLFVFFSMSHYFDLLANSVFFQWHSGSFPFVHTLRNFFRFCNSLREPTSTAGRRITGVGIINVVIWGLPERRKLLDKPPNRRFDLFQPVFYTIHLFGFYCPHFPWFLLNM